MLSVWYVALGTVALVVLRRWLEFREAARSLGHHPGFRTLLSIYGVFNHFLCAWAVPGITLGRFRIWIEKHADFEYFGSDVITHVSAFPNVWRTLFVADAAVIKEITAQRTKFPKPVQFQYQVLTFFGRNIVASEGEEWKKYRKVTAPAFSEPNNKLVWEETVRIVNDLFNDVWGTQERIVSDHVVEVTLPIALFVIGAAGFGRRVSWKEDVVVPSGHKMTFKDALHVVSTQVVTKVLFPDWLLKYAPIKVLRETHNAYKELEDYMMEMVQERRTAEKKEERHDLFSSLLDASDEETDADKRLSDRELLGNIFIFLLAGHETTAHTLCFAFALLALYPKEQENLFEHIKTVLQFGRLPTYEDMNALTYSEAVFYETLRLYPPVPGIPKIAAEDTVITTTNASGEAVAIPVPKDTSITLDVAALHYNPRYWEDPYAFKPSRFLGNWPRDAFLPFSSGPRACLGRRFFETEGIAILTMLISRYRVELKDEPEFAHETFEEKKERLMQCRPGLTMTPIKLPLVFVRR